MAINLRSRALAAPPDAANELTDETVDLTADAERAQLRGDGCGARRARPR